MPRVVRNFWIDTNIDDRQSNLASGPRRADGGFQQAIYIRNKGQVDQILYIEGSVIPETGELRLIVKQKRGSQMVHLAEIKTER